MFIKHDIKNNIINNIELFYNNFQDFLTKEADIFSKVIKNIQSNFNSMNEKELIKLSLCLNVLLNVAEKMKNFSQDDKFCDLLKGGHLIIYDNGALYKDLKKAGNNFAILRKRLSSHHKNRLNPNEHDIGIDTEVFGELLVGTTKEGHTYMQFEGAPIKDLWSFIVHMMHYIQYKVTGKNVGYLGISDFTEANPIVIEQQKSNNNELTVRVMPSHLKLNVAALKDETRNQILV